MTYLPKLFLQKPLAKEIFIKRRNNVLAKMQAGSAAIFFAATEQQRNSDSNFLFRQHSDFWYLTGFDEPEAALLLVKSDETHSHTVIFNRVRDEAAEIWNGRRLGQDAAPAALGVDRALAFSEIDQHLHLMLNGLDAVYHAQGEFAYADKIVFAALDKLRNGFRQNWQAPANMIDWRPFVHEIRVFKSEDELELMRKACEISAIGHNHALQVCRAGMTEAQLEGEIHYTFSKHGARTPSYNTIVGGGENACILHYTENNQPLKSGELVLIDAGAEFQNYAGDITRTFPINGKFSKAQREIYDLVLSTLNKALELFKPGTSVYEVNQVVIRMMVEGLVKLGIMKGDIDTLIKDEAHKKFYMHGLGHWLGLDVHDVGSTGSVKRDRKLEPGMVLTVEPGIYIQPYFDDVPAEYRGIGVRIEDDILITETGNENLTALAIKDPDEIEAYMAKYQQ